MVFQAIDQDKEKKDKKNVWEQLLRKTKRIFFLGEGKKKPKDFIIILKGNNNFFHIPFPPL